MAALGKVCILLLIVFVVGTEAYRGGWRNRHHCGWVKCEPNCRKVKDEDGCFKCDCGPLCTPPKCDPGCEVQEVFDGPCPGCECKDEGREDDTDLVNGGVGDYDGAYVRHYKWMVHGCSHVHHGKGGWRNRHRCRWVKCEPNCRKVKDEDGCFKCDCGPLCTPPKCDPGCEVQKVFDGPCPGCECKDEGKEDDIDLVNVGEEKPTVVCDPPKCEPGCTIEEEYDGPCPGCECKDEGQEDDTDLVNVGDVPLERICEPVKCGAPCKEVSGGPNDCPKCLCEVCSPPKCPEGCKIQKVFDGLCPGCDCEDDCPRVTCPPTGSIIKDENGCDICLFEPECIPVERCGRWCKKYKNDDGCLVCDCEYRGRWKHKRY